ncbi:hypothetical protein SSP35_22_00100 [Streptomyces sp. NBRC 110611]|uniref:DUF6233 domain-containing protein n=1 Tax=Streptomyces sp. NBRC 110611 TaxID=1621259 RepID=UPI0008565131|nr:DUF6233 domain-containing protein [Streptomyces sp. NBRC 110611]GAU70707.1 hypothetical protein SSP35_22_00100 [Streptomyces sp. NBRC 110611]
MGGSPTQPYARITLILPNKQTVEVRLYERLQTTGRFPWRFRIGVPSWVATEDGVEPAEYSVWVTDRQLRPIEGVDLSMVPTHRSLEALPTPKPSGWVVRPDPQRRGGTLVHDGICQHAGGKGRELSFLEALDALMRPGAKACYDCAAAEVLLPALELGQEYG